MSFRMLHSVAALLFCSISPLSVFAADNAVQTQIQPGAVSSLILDITSAGEQLVAVGERGHVLLLSDSWHQVQTPVAVQLTKVFFLNDKLGWAVGHDATIIHSQDGGQTWQVQMQSIELEKPFLDVLFLDPLHGVAVGAYGMFYRTLDGGKNWTAEFHQELLFEEDVSYLAELKESNPEAYASESASLLPHFNRIIALQDGRLLLVGELGLVAISSDQGQHFSRTSFDYDGSMFNVIETDTGIYALGLRGHVFKTDNSLEQWDEIEMPIESTLNSAIQQSDSSLYLVGNAGIVIKLNTDDVASIVERRQGENIVSVARDSLGQLWLGGSNGLSKLTH